ncbi:MAG: hypothetical protein CSA26_05645 [Desulfobacterales bacterium]|nr:MAG: hypothetical protein CSA26_05645 [Desulfobacterales bacterium]
MIEQPVYPGNKPEVKKAPQQLVLPEIASNEKVVMDEKKQEVLLPIDYVNDRIFEYGRKLERWKQLDNQAVVMNLTDEQTASMVRCFKDLQQVLTAYRRLHDHLLQRNVLSETEKFRSEDVLALQRQDIAFLDSVCGKMLGGGTDDSSTGWEERSEDADLNQIETLIERYFANKEYDEVVQVWLKVPSYQVERIGLKSKLFYANALIYLGQQEKAAEIYYQIVKEMSVSKEQPTDLLSLRKVLADLYTASGNFLAAENQYEQISSDYLKIGRIDEWSKLQLSILDRSQEGSPELTEFSQLLKEYLGFSPERDGYRIVWHADTFLKKYPYSPVSSNVDIIRADALKRADEWFNAFFSEADTLAAEKKFQDGIELLQTIPKESISVEQNQTVTAKIDELVLGEAVERETLKIERMQELQRQWNNGMKLAEQKDFDAAIALFTELLDTEYSSKAEVKIEELSLQAAKGDRKKAADFFVRFTKTEDLESRKRLLVESRKILKGILVKYPEVEIAQRVLGNIDRVEKEMNKIDPTLLQMIEKEERQQAAQESPLEETPAVIDAFELPAIPVESNETEGAQPPPVPVVEETAPSASLPVLTPQDMQ